MMNLSEPDQYALLVQALTGLADRITDDVNALGRGRRNDDERTRLTRHRDDLKHILGRLTEVGDTVEDDEDTEDVADAVRQLAAYLTGVFQPGWPPTHPYPGQDSDRAGRGDPGHCWICAIVGHIVAHPERGCAEVRCTSSHDGSEEVTVAGYAAVTPLFLRLAGPVPVPPTVPGRLY